MATSEVEYDGVTYTRICGYPITGMFTAWPCCLEPDHKGDHAFSASYASYFQDKDGLMYIHLGRETSG